MHMFKPDAISKPAAKIRAVLEKQGYIADETIASAIYLSQELKRPLLVEGPAGVGKTDIAKVMATSLDTELIRLQCYEGLDASSSLYEWNYQRQLLQIKLEEHENKSLKEKEQSIFSQDFLLQRPLLKAITQKRTVVLLIDELDRADEEFESFLLELLSDWQITIPELGTIKAGHIPQVVITGNRTRDLSDAVRRRCLYLWIDYPPYEKELQIVRTRLPGIDQRLSEQVCRFMETLRNQKLQKVPGVAETLDWAKALAILHQEQLDAQVVFQTLGIILKEVSDIQFVSQSLTELLDATGVQQKSLPRDFLSQQAG